MSKLFYLALGGALGTLLRYALSIWFFTPGASGFPVGTFLANMIGCLAIGITLSFFLDLDYSHPLRLFFVIGLLGAFTTFSSFAFEGFSLIRSNQIKTAILYMLSSNLMGLLLVYLGYQAAKYLQ